MPRNEVPGLIDRAASLFGLHESCVENPIWVSYQPGGFFGPHMDGGSRPDVAAQAGQTYAARNISLFVYLNDVVKGGGTRFPKAKPEVTVQPKVGLACLHFCGHKIDNSPLEVSVSIHGTYHEGLPVDEPKHLLAFFGWNVSLPSGPASKTATSDIVL